MTSSISLSSYRTLEDVADGLVIVALAAAGDRVYLKDEVLMRLCAVEAATAARERDRAEDMYRAFRHAIDALSDERLTLMAELDTLRKTLESERERAETAEAHAARFAAQNVKATQ